MRSSSSSDGSRFDSGTKYAGRTSPDTGAPVGRKRIRTNDAEELESWIRSNPDHPAPESESPARSRPGAAGLLRLAAIVAIAIVAIFTGATGAVQPGFAVGAISPDGGGYRGTAGDDLGRFFYIMASSVMWTFRRPFDGAELMRQMVRVG